MSVPELNISAPKMKEGFIKVLNKILSDQTNPLECKLTPLLSRAKSQKSTNKLLARHIKRRSDILEKRHKAKVAHKKPNILDTPRERKFQKLATNGVVKLFNAVNKEQKNMGEKLKTAKTEAKKSSLIKSFDKSGFIDMLLNENRTETETIVRNRQQNSESSSNAESDGEEYSD